MTHAPNWRPARSVCASEFLTRADFEAHAAAGITTVELSFAYELYAGLNWKEMAEFSADCGIELWSLHLPFHAERANPAHLSPVIRRDTLDWDRELLYRAAELGIHTAVIHASGEPIADKVRAASMEYATRSLSHLNELCAALGITLAVENLPRTCIGKNSDEILQLLAAVPGMRLCFDTNHLMEQSHVDFVKAVAPYLHTLHVSDYDFLNERHWLPGEGKVDWPQLIGALEAADYNGPLLYEVSLKTPDTITRRDLTPADFYANYQALVRHEQPAAVGTPKPGLTGWK